MYKRYYTNKMHYVTYTEYYFLFLYIHCMYTKEKNQSNTTLHGHESSPVKISVIAGPMLYQEYIAKSVQLPIRKHCHLIPSNSVSLNITN